MKFTKMIEITWGHDAPEFEIQKKKEIIHKFMDRILCSLPLKKNQFLKCKMSMHYSGCSENTWWVSAHFSRCFGSPCEPGKMIKSTVPRGGIGPRGIAIVGEEIFQEIAPEEYYSSPYNARMAFEELVNWVIKKLK